MEQTCELVEGCAPDAQLCEVFHGTIFELLKEYQASDIMFDSHRAATRGCEAIEDGMSTTQALRDWYGIARRYSNQLIVVLRAFVSWSALRDAGTHKFFGRRPKLGQVAHTPVPVHLFSLP